MEYADIKLDLESWSIDCEISYTVDCGYVPDIAGDESTLSFEDILLVEVNQFILIHGKGRTEIEKDNVNELVKHELERNREDVVEQIIEQMETEHV